MDVADLTLLSSDENTSTHHQTLDHSERFTRGICVVGVSLPNHSPMSGSYRDHWEHPVLSGTGEWCFLSRTVTGM